MKTASLKRLMLLSRPHFRALTLGMIALGLGAAINLAFPAIIREILDESQGSYLLEHLWQVAGLLIALFAVQGVCFYYRFSLFGFVGQRVVADLRDRLYAAMLHREIEFFDRSRVGDLVSRLNSDALMIQDAAGIKLSVLVRYSIQVAGGIVLMCFISFKLTAAILLSLPLLIVLSVWLGRGLKRLSRRQQAELGTATTIADETLMGVRVVRAFGREKFELNRFGAAIQNTLETGLKRISLAAFFASFVNALMNICIVLVMIFGLSLVQTGGMTYGDLTAFMLYGSIVAISFAFLAGTYAEFVQAAGAAERIFELLDSAIVAPAAADCIAMPSPVRGEVLLKGVSFAYPSRPDLQVLNSIDLTLEAGKITALAGPSGGGKSTIVSLILRFYDPSAGKISFDGADIGRLDPAELRRQIAIVPQDPQLFGMTLADNLRYGKPDATDAEMEAACEKAFILDFIRTLPDGLQTSAGQAGISLSGGQRQRLAIARAILRSPALLILDEATSALDSESEFMVHAALKSLFAGRTVLIIAHRLATIKDAQQVLVLENGGIIQRGTHSSLSREAGLYRQFVEKQELFVPHEGAPPA